MSRSCVVTLTGHVLPADGPLLRDHVRPAARRSDHYLARYDRTTLYYDCVRLPGRDAVLFTAPRFLNLWRPFRDGLRVDGLRPRRMRRRTWLRCEQVEVPAPAGPLTLDLGAGPVAVRVRDGIGETFAGLDAMVAVNRNNRLDWVADWAGYHARAHGAEAIVLFDNGSDAYTPQELADRVSAVPGVKRVAVLSASYPYGPTDSAGRFEVSPRFFQTAMLNVARRDALAGARAVLSVDIDEIVRSARGASVFEAARRHPLGLITIPGSWVYPAPATPGPVGHGAHRFRAIPDRRCNQKWCIRPGGLMDRFGWAVHRLDEVIQNLATRQHDQRLLHCRGTSTGWKGARFDWPDRLAEDPDLADFLAANFPGAAGAHREAATADPAPVPADPPV